MAEVKNIPNWKEIIEYGAEKPKHQVLVNTNNYRSVLVGLEAGVTIPPHPSADASYHFLEGSGWMIVDDERYPVSAGTTMVVPAQAVRGIEAETRLAFLGSHGGKRTQQQSKPVLPRRKPMLLLGGMVLFMLVLMVGLWRIGASPMAMMFGGVGGMGAGLWGTMILPMLGLAGMVVMMVVMYRMMARMGGGMAHHEHAALMGDKTTIQQNTPARQTVRYTIPGISCGGCKQTIEARVTALAGISSVQVDVASQQATIGFDAPATKAKIEQFLVEIGYPAAA